MGHRTAGPTGPAETTPGSRRNWARGECAQFRPRSRSEDDLERQLRLPRQVRLGSDPSESASPDLSAGIGKDRVLQHIEPFSPDLPMHATQLPDVNRCGPRAHGLQYFRCQDYSTDSVRRADDPVLARSLQFHARKLLMIKSPGRHSMLTA